MRALFLAVAAALLLLWSPAATAQPGNLIAGPWSGTIAWDDGGTTNGVNWTFDEDGTFATSDNYHGVWSQYDTHAVWIISSYPRTVYEGEVSGNTMTARVHNMEGVVGTATMTRGGQSGGGVVRRKG